MENNACDSDQKQRLKELVDKYPEVFARNAEDIGCTGLTRHYVNLTSDKPVHAPYYKAPPPKVREELDRETDKLLAAGIARESQSPYSAPIVLVKKPDGSWRYCTDFRRLNKITPVSPYQTSRIACVVLRTREFFLVLI